MSRKSDQKKKVLTYGLPAEIAAGKTILRILNQNGCILEGNYQVENYTQSILCLKVSWGGICFRGNHFLIEQMDGALLSFTGQIESITYLA